MSTQANVIKNAIAAFTRNELPKTELEFSPERGRDGRCLLSIYAEGDWSVVICSEFAGNEGQSITNAAPAPWEAAEDEADLAQNVLWLEHYGPDSDGRREHVFDQVTLDSSRRPCWKRVATIPTVVAA